MGLIEYFYNNNNEIVYFTSVREARLITVSDACPLLPLSFPRGMDCILTRLRLLRPSSSSDYRSVSDGQP